MVRAVKHIAAVFIFVKVSLTAAFMPAMLEFRKVSFT